MSIRLKIVSIVLPLLITALAAAGTSSYFLATNGITRVTIELLDFKASELERHIESQWNLLVENEFTDIPEMVRAAESGIELYAAGLVRSETELILAINNAGQVVMSTGPYAIQPDERAELQSLLSRPTGDLVTFRLDGIERVGMGFPFAPFDWFVLITEHRDVFYSQVDRITTQTVLILLVGIVVSALLLVLFVRYLTRPLTGVVAAMERIISSNEFGDRVEVEFNDEIGRLSHTFNIMISELERAYSKIKSYAFDAVLAQKKEAKIRNIFQKYVPQDLIDKFFENPESMLVGDNRVLAVLFSDIRSFTSISESMRPDDLVNSLNRYFSVMVDIIMEHNGIIDKYIGDAIMAFFGAPVHHENDALQSVHAGIAMAEGLKGFNAEQRRLGRPEFQIGIGINYGEVTVGNIGTDKKMDYTVIGDMVNLASRLEGLTKQYQQALIISESLYSEVKDHVPCRLLDFVAVKGKTRGVRIYTTKAVLSPAEERAWELHNRAMELYSSSRFSDAVALFDEVLTLLPGDYAAELLSSRCKRYLVQPPEANWNGVEILTSK